ncbi:UbiA-like protein EboC [Fulvivirgaceae bacterium BMA10]|uniref:UbiA-like protein EboC n=1 Tax=Splendidivirga corallicola TaxID=3051826 RepID=A0ABT8KKK5_9BACT|nr:UbiA-like protein EboC [Fulvivirgaceae bacterium BMA10]
MSKLLAHIRLMRPANIITAIADILAGLAIASTGYQFIFSDTDYFWAAELNGAGWLILSTIGLYGGGVVLNDVFDAELDKKERPERPIPSGEVTVLSAASLGIILLFLGVLCAYQVSTLSAMLALSVAGLAVIYDWLGKHHAFLGPINMGLCRGGNLLLGISIVSEKVFEFWFVAFIPIVYIAAITTISRGEVHGGKKSAFNLGIILYIAVILSIFLITWFKEGNWYIQIPYLLLFSYFIFPPLFNARKTLKGPDIGKAVKAGVIALIVMDASIAAGFTGWLYGLFVLALLPLSLFLAKRFAVT